MGYGKELVLDLHDCDISKFNRTSLKSFFRELCILIKMEPADLHFWDDVGVPEEKKQTSLHTKGTSAVQFILTSNIVVHTLDLLGKVFVNIFSCKDFDAEAAKRFTVDWFNGKVAGEHIIRRI